MACPGLEGFNVGWRIAAILHIRACDSFPRPGQADRRARGEGGDVGLRNLDCPYGDYDWIWRSDESGLWELIFPPPECAFALN